MHNIHHDLDAYLNKRLLFTLLQNPVFIISVCMLITKSNSQYYGHRVPQRYASNSVYETNPSFASGSSSKYYYPKFISSNIRPLQTPSDNFVPSQPIETAPRPYKYQRFNPVSINKFRYINPLPPTTTNVPTSTILQTSKPFNENNVGDSASEGLKLLDDLVEIISKVSGTAADSI